jgi:hypothetical protein
VDPQLSPNRTAWISQIRDVQWSSRFHITASFIKPFSVFTARNHDGLDINVMGLRAIIGWKESVRDAHKLQNFTPGSVKLSRDIATILAKIQKP